MQTIHNIPKIAYKMLITMEHYEYFWSLAYIYTTESWYTVLMSTVVNDPFYGEGWFVSLTTVFAIVLSNFINY